MDAITHMPRSAKSLAILLLTSFAATSYAQSTPSLCEGSISDTQSLVIPSITKPSFMQYYTDPVFNSNIIRITDAQFGEVFKPMYSTVQAWNADESLLLLYKAGGGGHKLYNGHTYEPLLDLAILPADIEEVFWSHSDPDELFYVSKASGDYGEFKRYNVQNSSSTYITDFAQHCGTSGLPTAGNDVHMPSLDDDLFGFRCRKDDGSFVMLSYRISTDETVVKPIGEGTIWVDRIAPQPAPSGDRFWYQGKVLSTDLETVEAALDLYKYNEHSNIGTTHDGFDALYQTAFNASPNGCNGDSRNGVGHLVEHDLESGICRSIINQSQGYPYTTSATHVSAQAYQRPGWVAMSSVGKLDQMDAFFPGQAAAPALFSEIYLANTDPNDRVTCRLAHHRSFGKLATNGGYPAYFGEPHVTISPSGTRILFGSDWYDSGSVDSYVIELPGYVSPTYDSDNDGYCDTVTASNNASTCTGIDAFPNDPSEWADNDIDGIGDNADLDDDNDGVSDALDEDPLVADNNCTFGNASIAQFAEVVSNGVTTCAADTHITVSPPANVQNSGRLKLISPAVTFESGFSATALSVLSQAPCEFCQ